MDMLQFLFSSVWHWLGGLVYLVVLTKVRLFTITTKNRASDWASIGTKKESK